MRTAALIAGLVGFVGAVISGALNSLICVPCIALVLGAVAGYFACRTERPADQNGATRLGATAGGLAGLGTLIGSVVGGFTGAALLGPQGAESMTESIARSLGVTLPQASVSPVTYYASALGSSACCGVVEIFIMALLGALAGMVWFRQSRGDMPQPTAGT